jgi:GNAT superfamily N-acetyltransferase
VSPTTISEQSLDDLVAYARIPIAFEVRSVLDVTDDGAGGFSLTERPVATPWIKDYDAVPGEGPLAWAARWDLSRWGVLAAFLGAARVGGCAVARDTPGVEMLSGRADLAVLWDLRVAPELRRRGVGARLFAAACAWAAAHGCTEMKIETQDVNVGACRFYRAQGCELRAVDPNAYPRLPGEAALYWWRTLVGSP